MDVGKFVLTLLSVRSFPILYVKGVNILQTGTLWLRMNQNWPNEITSSEIALLKEIMCKTSRNCPLECECGITMAIPW